MTSPDVAFLEVASFVLVFIGASVVIPCLSSVTSCGVVFLVVTSLLLPLAADSVVIPWPCSVTYSDVVSCGASVAISSFCFVDASSGAGCVVVC